MGLASEQLPLRLLRFNATKLEAMPLPTVRPTDLARQLNDLSQRLQTHAPDGLLRRWESRGMMPGKNVKDSLDVREREWNLIREQMISLQEELDWDCYPLTGLLTRT